MTTVPEEWFCYLSKTAFIRYKKTSLGAMKKGEKSPQPSSFTFQKRLLLSIKKTSIALMKKREECFFQAAALAKTLGPLRVIKKDRVFIFQADKPLHHRAKKDRVFFSTPPTVLLDWFHQNVTFPKTLLLSIKRLKKSVFSKPQPLDLFPNRQALGTQKRSECFFPSRQPFRLTGSKM